MKAMEWDNHSQDVSGRNASRINVPDLWPMQMIIATNNRHKVEEIAAALPGHIVAVPLAEAVGPMEIEEDGLTLEANAVIKARAVHAITGQMCMADDTGLEVDALGGAPGVRSARYAGEECSFGDNIAKLLGAMTGMTDRRARFRTVICLKMADGTEHLFEGVVNGEILTACDGDGGFGYDPIFRPVGHQRSFARMSVEEKNDISHRGLAVRAMIDFLSTTA
jgi:XTP/dITP diphosphohydrolase